MKVITILALMLVLISCATPRKQTCQPKDTRCQILLFISTLDIPPIK